MFSFAFKIHLLEEYRNFYLLHMKKMEWFSKLNTEDRNHKAMLTKNKYKVRVTIIKSMSCIYYPLDWCSATPSTPPPTCGISSSGFTKPTRPSGRSTTGSSTPTRPGRCSRGATEHTGRKAPPSTRSSPSRTRVSPRTPGRSLAWSKSIIISKTIDFNIFLSRGKRREELYDYGAVMLDKFKKKSKMIAKVVSTLKDDDSSKRNETNDTVEKEAKEKSKSISSSSEDSRSSPESLSSRYAKCSFLSVLFIPYHIIQYYPC